MKIIMENWRSFLSEEEENPVDPDSRTNPTSDPERSEIQPGDDTTASSDTRGDISYIKVVEEEYKNWKKGMTDKNSKSWPIIAKYWSSIKRGAYIKRALERGLGNNNSGSMKRVKDKKTNKTKKVPMPFYELHWSAAFIQWCMSDKDEAWKRILKRDMETPSFGPATESNHQYYWGGALDNTMKLLNGESLLDDDWIYIPINNSGDKIVNGKPLMGFRSAELGLEYGPGDVALVHPIGRHHGDIVVSSGERIGGNVTSAVAIQRRPATSYLTKSLQAKEKIMSLAASRAG